MRKIVFIGILATLACALLDSGYGMSDDPVVAHGSSISSACPVYYARPDLRNCPSPDCGGDWLFEPPQPGQDPCVDDLPLVQYVTGIFIRNDDGTLTRIGPHCDQPLTGVLEPDPDYPGFEIFVYLACVS